MQQLVTVPGGVEPAPGADCPHGHSAPDPQRNGPYSPDRMMNKARVIHITLARCGSQWVRDVLCAPELNRYSVLPYSGVTFDLQTTGQFDLPGGMFSGPIFGMNPAEWKAARMPGDKALVVLRDPRDRMISTMFSLLYSHPANELVDHLRTQLLDLKRDGERIEYLIGEARYSMRFDLAWAAEARVDVRALRYENLIRDERKEFGEILDWLGWKVPGEVLDGIVDRLSFRRRSGRQPGEADVSSHYRTGVAGDWRNHFTREHGALWETLYPGYLRGIGYEQEDAWWKSLPRNRVDAAPAQLDPVEVLRMRNLELEQELSAKEREIRSLDQACVERLNLIQQLSAQLESQRV